MLAFQARSLRASPTAISGLKNARPPRLLAELPAELRVVALEAACNDPARLINLGPAAVEEPWSPAGLVRTLLGDWLAAKLLEEIPALLRTAQERGDPAAFLLDDRKARQALRMLDHGLRGLSLLQEEAETREARLLPLGYDSPPNLRTLELVAQANASMQLLIAHARGLPGADAPRSLAELNKFRATCAGWLHEAGFEYAEIARLLGREAPDEPAAQMRFRDALRKGRTRRRKSQPEKTSAVRDGVDGL